MNKSFKATLVSMYRKHPDDEKKERENDRDIDSKLAILSRWTATLHIRSYRDYHQAKNTGSLSTPNSRTPKQSIPHSFSFLVLLSFASFYITMGVVTYEMEVATTIPPAKMFKAFVLDSDNLIQKILPQAIKSVVTLEGDGGAGIIKQGDALMGALEKISNEIKFEAAYDGGSVCKSSSSYWTIGDIGIKEEEIKAGKEGASVMFKAI
ncbi:hypothetical protein SCA6_015739 [Theobroma cacao]